MGKGRHDEGEQEDGEAEDHEGHDGGVEGGLADLGDHLVHPVEVGAEVLEGLGQFARGFPGADDADEVEREDPRVQRQRFVQGQCRSRSGAGYPAAPRGTVRSCSPGRPHRGRARSVTPALTWKVMRVQNSISSRRPRPPRSLNSRTFEVRVLGAVVFLGSTLASVSHSPASRSFWSRLDSSEAGRLPVRLRPARQSPGIDRRA